jgi:hypothetical protein
MSVNKVILLEEDVGEEVWKDIPGYEGVYQASTFGRVKSLARRINYKDSPRFRDVKEIIMKEHTNKSGYKVIILRKDEKSITFKTHQLIAMAFLDHQRNGNNMVVDHVNGDKLNNNLVNLNIIHNRLNISKGMRPNGFTGVHKRYNKYRAMIRINNNLIHLGTFETAEEASLAYNKELIKNIK